MGDNFFDPEGFTVPAGATVTFNLTNDGAAIHNMRIAGEDGDYNTDDDAVSDPDLVSPGDSAVLEWTAPGEPGDFAFQCDIHPTDMLGTITVE
jgi:plastocyanin